MTDHDRVLSLFILHNTHYYSAIFNFTCTFAQLHMLVESGKQMFDRVKVLLMTRGAGESLLTAESAMRLAVLEHGST